MKMLRFDTSCYGFDICCQKSTILKAKILVFSQVYKCIYDKNALSNLNRSIKHKLNDEFQYKQYVTLLTYCFVFRQGLSIP